MPSKHVRVPHGGLEAYLGPIDETPHTAAPEGNPLPKPSPKDKWFNPDLPMFVRAGDLADPEQYRPNDRPGKAYAQRIVETMTGETLPYEQIDTLQVLKDKKVWEAKQPKDPEIHGSGLYEDIKQNQVREPVTVTMRDSSPEKKLFEGHHRVYASEDIDPNREVPVEYFDINETDTQKHLLAQARNRRYERANRK